MHNINLLLLIVIIDIFYYILFLENKQNLWVSWANLKRCLTSCCSQHRMMEISIISAPIYYVMPQRTLILCISLYTITIRLIFNTIIVNHMRPLYLNIFQNWQLRWCSINRYPCHSRNAWNWTRSFWNRDSLVLI